jgi:spermidine/putrescine transport system substrate-binding protein
MLTEAINYISAVPAAQGVIAADARKASGSNKQLLGQVATSPLVWPSPAVYDRLHDYVDVSGKLEAEYKSIFNPIIAS